ncbi:MAG: sugar O-acetyltransferase [Bacillota bacterium]|nr:sugar O-acetyltransferase [Bacillota bacterium]
MNEKEKRDLGLAYDANFNEDLLKERQKAEELCFRFNSLSPTEEGAKRAVLEALIPGYPKSATILSPFIADYGYNVSIGEGSFINHGAYLMDCAPISIGSHVFIGPNLGAYTAIHPLDIESRNKGLEKAKPIVIEDDVWIASDVTILPGAKIGHGSVIGAKSLVSGEIPPNVLAYGNPVRVIKPIDQDKHWDEAE